MWRLPAAQAANRFRSQDVAGLGVPAVSEATNARSALSVVSSSGVMLRDRMRHNLGALGDFMRLHLSVCSVCVLVQAFTGLTLDAQAPSRTVAVSTAAAASTYSVPKTPWGDPDLQATWSGDSAFGIPLQRPENLGTKAELTDEEFTAKLKRDEDTRKRAENAVGSFRNDNAWLTRSFRQTSLIVDPANGRTPPLVAGAEKRRTPQGTYGNGPLNGPQDFTLYDRCITLGVVGSMTPKIYGNGYRIVQAPGYVVLMAEMIHEARVIPLDGRPHVGAAVRGYMGDSRGHFEGNTLVIETTNFNGKATVPGNPVLASTELKIVERITRIEKDLLRYEATITDPNTYTKPYTLVIPFTSPEGYQVLPYECHEGNLAVLQGLGGERAEDKALEEDAKRGIIRPRRPIQGELSVGGQPIQQNAPANQR
ncbi:MAG TPA: hypothetical protein VFB85_22365 [Vicinamibacterales bacterium]|jgi:hypothetical protein|nr:hypothetical protein [Vicinamibacterales bacterium]